MIRALTAADLGGFKALRLEGIRSYPEAFLLTEAEALSAPDAALARWLESGAAHGVFEEERLIGFAGLALRMQDGLRHRAAVGPFYVTPSAQGTGAAQALMEHLTRMARAQGARQLELWVWEGNARARVFYAAQGFAKTGRLPRAVIRGGLATDDLLLVRMLDAVAADAPGGDGLRRLDPGDWRLFRDVRLAMLRDTPRAFGSTEAEWSAKAPSEIADWLDAIRVWAVVEAGRALSCAGWHQTGGEISRHRGYIIAVFTRPEARGRGLMRRVLAAIEGDARALGVTQLELDVATHGVAARAAYAAAGFVETGLMPNAMQHDGQFSDMLTMCKPLSA